MRTGISIFLTLVGGFPLKKLAFSGKILTVFVVLFLIFVHLEIRLVEHLQDVHSAYPGSAADTEGQPVIERGILGVPRPAVLAWPLEERAVRLAGGLGRDDDKLVPAIPAQKIRFSDGFSEDLRACPQDAVSMQVPVGVVDPLESLISIKMKDRRSP